MKCFSFVLKIIFLCAATLFSATADGQATADLALKNLKRQKWQRAYELLTKALTKDSLNVTAKYVFAQYFFSEENPAFHLDSAYRHIRGAISDFNNTSSKQREKLRRFPLDSILLGNLRNKIELTAFSQTKAIQTEEAWIYFIEHFQFSFHIPQALKLRDSVAYEKARSENTYSGFQNFFLKYPNALQSLVARQNYEKLLLEDRTSDQSLASFEAFLAEHPTTSYRSKVEQTIFEYRTASGEYQTFIEFIKSYPENAFVKKAKNILFHLLPRAERTNRWPPEFSDDSLRTMLQLEESYLVPFLKNKKLGFMDAEANEIIQAQIDSMDEVYNCGNISEDIIALPDKIISKNGTVIWNKKTIGVDDIGVGFLLVEGEGCKSLIHKTGFQIGAHCIDDAKILNGKFIAIKNDDRWSVWTLTGRPLVEEVEDVFSIREVICLKENNKIRLVTTSTLSQLPLPPEYRGSHTYDHVAYWNHELILVKNGKQTGLTNQSLQTFVPLGNHALKPAFFGVIDTDSSAVCIYNFAGQKAEKFENAMVRNPWVAVKDSLWSLINPNTMQAFTSGYDTVVFSGIFAIGNKGDSSHIFFTSHYHQKLRQPLNIEFVPGKDSSAFLMIDQNGRKILYNRSGQKLFSTTADKIHYAGDDLFIVHKKEKKGLITIKGKPLLPLQYDAVGTVNNGLLSLLKSMKFGLYDHKRNKLIPPSYQKNLTPYNDNIIAAYKGGSYGFIGWDNKALSKFEFDEIKYWNDTTALVKKNSQWMLYEIETGKVLLDDIKDLKLIRDTPLDKLAIIYQGANHGVIHNRKGVIVPISFSDVVNVGSDEKPLYFTEKKVEEASIFVVIYYNDQGKMLRKEIYDQADYDKIYCHAN